MNSYTITRIVILSSFLSFLLFAIFFSLNANSKSNYIEKIDPLLLNNLQNYNDDDLVQIELEISGGISAIELEKEMDGRFSTLDERRRYGLNRLREIAKKTQTELQSKLENLKETGDVKKYESHWLTNTITVDLKKSSIEKIVSLSSVEEIFQYPTLKQIEPEIYHDVNNRLNLSQGGIEPNLIYCGADSAWKMGFTGKGRIVCTSESVYGLHPAYKKSWKGLDGDVRAACRYADFPNANTSHGTHVLGIMVGHDDETGDTIGVALDAQWIDCGRPDFEWIADPDNDPNTTADMPDVVNISMFTSSGCYDRWWDLIDMVETLGIIVVESAGNFGPGYMTVTSPASRAVDSLTNFAIGSMDYRTDNLKRTSGRGPSPCDSISIKPNICAPGAYIRSSINGGEYDIYGGTSMAAPHVAGAVAILRQYAPNATTREIKEALIGGAIPKGDPYPNYHFGWGVLNIPGSIEFLSTDYGADLRIVSYDYDQEVVHDTVSIDLKIKNHGYPSDEVYVKFFNNHEGITVLTDSILYSTVARDQFSSGDKSLRIIFDDTMYPGAIIPVDYEMFGSNSIPHSGKIHVQAGIEGEKSFFTHKNDLLQFTVSNIGQYNNFKYKDTVYNRLQEASLLIGTDIEHISDNLRDIDRLPDNDFWYDATNPLEIRIPGESADQESFCIFDDGRSENRIGVQVEQTTYSWDDSGDNNYIIMEYVLENISNKKIDSLSVGLTIDWSFGYRNNDSRCEGGFSRLNNLGYLFRHYYKPDSIEFKGITVLNHEGIMSYNTFFQDRLGYLPNPGISDSIKFISLFGGINDSSTIAPQNESIMHSISTGPFTLSPGESDTAVFVILASDSLLELYESVDNARKKWENINKLNDVPSNFILEQNYPNPFNSTTRIEFYLPHISHVTLNIYNILGQRVRTLVDGEKEAGLNSITWDGKNNQRKEVSSGIYFYELKIEDDKISKKMILVK